MLPPSLFARRYGWLAYWLLHVGLALNESRFPGYNPDHDPSPYPWREALLTCVPLFDFCAALQAIICPETFNRSWGRLAVASVLLLVLPARVWNLIDMPGYFYVPANFCVWTLFVLPFVGLLLMRYPAPPPVSGAPAAFRLSRSQLVSGSAVLLACLIGWWVCKHRYTLDHEFVSPDGRFAVAVYKEWSFFGYSSQGDDAPGFAALVRWPGGKQLERLNLEKVQLVSEVRWDDDSVSLADLSGWHLPKKRVRSLGR